MLSKRRHGGSFSTTRLLHFTSPLPGSENEEPIAFHHGVNFEAHSGIPTLMPVEISHAHTILFHHRPHFRSDLKKKNRTPTRRTPTDNATNGKTSESRSGHHHQRCVQVALNHQSSIPSSHSSQHRIAVRCTASSSTRHFSRLRLQDRTTNDDFRCFRNRKQPNIKKQGSIMPPLQTQT